MELNDAIGKLVLFKFQENMVKDFNIFDICGENIWGVLSGIEPNVGVWIKHPKYELGIWWDKDGKTISEESRKKENFETDILIPWQYIKGIMCVRNDRFNKESQEKMSIGFHIYDKK